MAVHPDPAKALVSAEQELLDKLDKSSDKDRPAVQEQLDALQARREEMLPSLEQLRDMAQSAVDSDLRFSIEKSRWSLTTGPNPNWALAA